MSGDAFLDTNIFIYAFDRTAPTKRARALELIQQSNWIISWQVIQEFTNVALHKFKTPLKAKDLGDYIDLILWPHCFVLPSAEIYHRAMEIQAQTQYHFYDSLMLAAAQAAGATTLYSEDMQHGRTFDALQIQNPFLR